ncbi:MAG: phrB [Ramlibacter sp.]|nr:phrB [Ramlibacter sp.]
MEPSCESALLWYRRDLRVADQAALYHALTSARRVHCVFVFDTAILQGLPRRDRRVEFIRAAAAALDGQLRALGGPGSGLPVPRSCCASSPPVDLAAAGIALGRGYRLPIVDDAQAHAATLRRYAAVKAG